MKRLVIFFFFISLAGCATLPPAVEDGQYHNYRLGFVVNLPGADWQTLNQIPEPFAGYFKENASPKVLLILFNQKTKGLLLVTGVYAFVPYEYGTSLLDVTTEPLKIMIDRERTALFKGPFLEDSVYYTYCDASGLYWKEKGQMELAGVKRYSSGFVYPLGSETCFITFHVLSALSSYEGNHLIYQKFLKSFNRGEVLTTKNYGW
jgi:hypothetical protein